MYHHLHWFFPLFRKRAPSLNQTLIPAMWIPFSTPPSPARPSQGVRWVQLLHICVDFKLSSPFLETGGHVRLFFLASRLLEFHFCGGLFFFFFLKEMDLVYVSQVFTFHEFLSNFFLELPLFWEVLLFFLQSSFNISKCLKWKRQISRNPFFDHRRTLSVG